MKTLEIVGYYRKDLGSKYAKNLRKDAQVPCVLYGTDVHIHFSAPMILFRDLVYTQDAHKVLLNIEGDTHEAILQDIQFHPISEIILHADFLLLEKDKPVKMNVPIRFTGQGKAIQAGGKLNPKLRYLTVEALPDNLPADISISVEELELGKSIKVNEIQSEENNYKILNNPLVSVVAVEIPRAVRQKQKEDEAAAAAEEE